MLSIPLLPFSLILSAILVKGGQTLPIPDFIVQGVSAVLLTAPRITTGCNVDSRFNSFRLVRRGG